MNPNHCLIESRAPLFRYPSQEEIQKKDHFLKQLALLLNHSVNIQTNMNHEIPKE
ncbi:MULTISPECIES: hypothetical protein [Bacillales]|uniref:Uncharacterized protein n=1 Tax=Anoxybacteroides amylolyticum TaxID=294699 RepID=A0A167T2S7_9BACL|nr:MULTISPECIES: hypothetical protein [Bacillaceae]ANB59364.1 hypothetical protein GFC30_239 [Anoxybacillus amylolyticus]